MKDIYCPHLQDVFDKNKMIWVHMIGLNISLRGNQNLVICEKCSTTVEERVFSNASRRAKDNIKRLDYPK